MLKHIGIRNYKGIKDAIEIRNLGKINVICGKNNSGKTSILEAIENKKHIGYAINEEDLPKFEARFLSQAERFSGPSPEVSMSWFKKHMTEIAKENTIWFSDDISKIIGAYQESLKRDKVLGRHDPAIFKYDGVIKSFFEDVERSYKPILIPPKRHLESVNGILLDQKVASDGTGLLNRFFYLKNQDLDSHEFKTYKLIYDAFNEITGHRFNIIPDTNNNVTLYFRERRRDWIRANECGLGLSDALVILALTIDFDYSLILIEEPESHLHPDMQRRLLSYLRTNIDKQFFVTTHSNIFLDNVIVDKVYFASFSKSIALNDYTSRAAILGDLGYSIADNLVSDLVVLVEGPKDIPIIEEYLKKMNLYNHFDIKIWPLGGDIMDQLDLSVFAQNYSILGLIDNDPGSGKIRERFIRNCEKNKIEVVRLVSYSIENYFSPRVLKEIFGAQISSSLNTIRPDVKLEDQIGLNVKNNNKKLAQAMTIEEIENTDLYHFLLKIKAICESKGILDRDI